ncbi:MAG: hypothetical protein IPM56_14060 [Ignavibacteriales bacterium]|nr:MAG: hypothetical protein IPM56_14060 [Ignavibacteriales bacterium]
MKRRTSGKINFKKIIAVFASLMLLYNTGGYIVVYQQLIADTKQENHLAISEKKVKEKIILLSFRITDIENKTIDFIWKHSKEFKFNGDMYDIVERIDTKDSVHFYCFLDKKENKLNAAFNDQYENDLEEKKRKTSGRSLAAQQVTDLFLALIILSTPDCAGQKYLSLLEKGYLNNEPDIPSPPPKILIT